MKILLFCMLLVFGATFRPLRAQDTLPDPAINLPTVTLVYYANPTAPLTFQNLDGKELSTRSTGQEPSFLLSETPSVTAYSDAGNTQGYSYFRIRGIDQTRINISFDGVPLNEPEDQGAFFANFPDLFNGLSSVQIQRGVGSTKNGVASYGGSVQLFSPLLDTDASTTFGVGYGSFNSMRAFGEFRSGLKKNKALYVRASHVQSDGYKYDAGNKGQSALVSGGLFYDKTTWRFNLLAGFQQNRLAWLGVADSLIALDPRTNANINERDRFGQCLAQVQQIWRPNAHSALQTSLYYTFLDGNYDFNLNGFLGLPSTEEMYNYAFRSHLWGVFSNFVFTQNNLKWTTGVHGQRYRRQHIGSELALGQLYSNTGFKQESSLFTKLEYRWGKFIFRADLQYRHSTFAYEGSVDMPVQEWHFFNPKGGISYEIRDDISMYYSIGRTGREPTRNDLFGGNDDLLADSTGNALLFIATAEFLLDHELGIRINREKIQLQANLFYMDFENEIVLDGNFGPNGLALTNKVENSFRAGIEWQVDYRPLKWLRLIHNGSFNYSRIREQGITFRPILTPPVLLNQDVVFEWGRFSFAVSGRFQDDAFIDYANTAQVERYVLLNARACYDNGRFRVSIFGNNLTNIQYFNQGYIDYDGTRKLFVQAPINGYLALQYQF